MDNHVGSLIAASLITPSQLFLQSYLGLKALDLPQSLRKKKKKIAYGLISYPKITVIFGILPCSVQFTF